MTRRITTFIPLLWFSASVFLVLIPVPITGVQAVLPNVSIMVLFFFVLLSPNLLPYWFLFVFGFIQDHIVATPFGFHSLAYLLFHSAAKYMLADRVYRDFAPIWKIFASLAFAFALLQWVIFMVYYGSFLSPHLAIMQTIYTVLLFPLIYRGLFWAYSHSG